MIIIDLRKYKVFKVPKICQDSPVDTLNVTRRIIVPTYGSFTAD